MSALPSIRRLRQPSLARREALWGYVFLSPWIVGFLALTLIPMVATLGVTFTNIDLAQNEPIRFVGLDNYARLFSDGDAWRSLLVTLKYAAPPLPIRPVIPVRF